MPQPGEVLQGQLGVMYPNESILTDEHWRCVSDVMRGMHGFGFVSAKEDVGRLIYYDGDKWKDYICEEVVASEAEASQVRQSSPDPES